MQVENVHFVDGEAKTEKEFLKILQKNVFQNSPHSLLSHIQLTFQHTVIQLSVMPPNPSITKF